MKSAVKRAGLRLLTAPLVYNALRARAHAGDPLTILCYHTLRSDEDRLESWLALSMPAFRAQIAFLRDHYDIVSLDDALEARGRPGRRPRAVLTFDDGESAMHDLLLPFVETEKLPVTLYLATGQIETGHPYWFDRVMNALQGDAARHIDMRAHGLEAWDFGSARGSAHWAQIGTILEALKTVPEKDRDALSDMIAAQGSPAPKGATPFRPMTLEELQTVAASDYITIGAHSHGHELLDRLPLEDALTSVLRSRDLLEHWTGQKIRHFAYPNGNYTVPLMTGLAEAGFASATILEERLALPDAPQMALPRIGVGRYDSLNRIRLRVVGV